MFVLVYALRNRHTSGVYIGQTNNLNKRLADHAAKVNGNCGTGTTAAMHADCAGESFEKAFSVEVVGMHRDSVKASLTEVAFIRKLREEGAKLYNTHKGGSGTGTGRLPVFCTTTGQRFDDAQAAARHFCLHPTAILSALKTGTPTGCGRKAGKIVTCVETGETWPGLVALAASLQRDCMGVYHLLRYGGVFEGRTYTVEDRVPLYFEWVTED